MSRSYLPRLPVRSLILLRYTAVGVLTVVFLIGTYLSLYLHRFENMRRLSVESNSQFQGTCLLSSSTQSRVGLGLAFLCSIPREVHVHDARLPGHAVRFMLSCIYTNDVDVLDLSGTTMNDSDLEDILQDCPHVRFLNLDGTHITDAVLPAILRLPELDEVHVEGTSISSRCAELDQLGARNVRVFRTATYRSWKVEKTPLWASLRPMSQDNWIAINPRYVPWERAHYERESP